MSGFDEAAIAAREEGVPVPQDAPTMLSDEEVARVLQAEKDEQHAKAMQSAWNDALIVQSACNLSGVVFSFAWHMHTLCEEGRRQGQGTDWRNTHPIVRMFVTQLLHLSFGESVDVQKYHEAYEAACQHADERTREMCLPY